MNRPSIKNYHRQLMEAPRALNDPRADRWPLTYFIQAMEFCCEKRGEIIAFFCTIYEDKKRL